MDYSSEDLDNFDSYVEGLISEGVIDEASLNSQDVYKQLKTEYARANFEREDQFRIKKAEFDSLDSLTVNELRQNRNKFIEEDQEKNTISRFQSSVQKAKKGVGNFLQVLSDSSVIDVAPYVNPAVAIPKSLGFDPIKGVTSLAKSNMERVGKNMAKQATKTLEDYVPTYAGSFLDQEGLGDKTGWIWEQIVSNSVNTGVQLVGTVAATASAPFTGGASLAAIPAFVGYGTVQGVGEYKELLESKGVYEDGDANKVLAMGIVSSLIDAGGATKLVPKKELFKRAFFNGTVDKIEKEIVQTGIVKTLKEGGKGLLAEGATELLQEGLFISGALAEGADYEDGEIFNQLVDGFVVGGAMGSGIRGGGSIVQQSVANLKNKGIPITREALLEESSDASESLDQELADIDAREVNEDGALSDAPFSGKINGLTPEETRTLASEIITHNDAAGFGKYNFTQSQLFEANIIEPSVKKTDEKQPEIVWAGDNTKEGFEGNSVLQDSVFVDYINKSLSDNTNVSPENIVQQVKNLFNINTEITLEPENTIVVPPSKIRIKEEVKSIAPDGSPTTSFEYSNRDVEAKVVELSTLKTQDEVIENVSIGHLGVDTTSPDIGSPVLNKKGEVVNGSKRLASIKKLYDEGGSEKYIDLVSKQASDIGLDVDVSEMNQPVIIREISDKKKESREPPVYGGEIDTKTKRESVESLIKSTGSFLKRTLGGQVRNLGEEVFSSVERYTDGSAATSNLTSRKTASAIREIDKNINPERYGNRTIDEINQERSRYQRTKNTNTWLPPEDKAQFDLMRNVLDAESVRYAENLRKTLRYNLGDEQYQSALNNYNAQKSGIKVDLDPEQQTIQNDANKQFEAVDRIQENLGSYLTRTYRVHTDKGFVNEILKNTNTKNYELAEEYFGNKLFKNSEEYRSSSESKRKKLRIHALESFVHGVTSDGTYSSESVKVSEDLVKMRSKELTDNPELRRFLGEVTDPVAAFDFAQRRIRKESAFQEMYLTISEKIGDFTTKDPVLAKERGWTEINVSEGDIIKNPLHKVYAPPEISSGLTNLLNQRNERDGVDKIWDWMISGNGIWQAAKIIPSVPTHAMNLASAGSIMAATLSSDVSKATALMGEYYSSKSRTTRLIKPSNKVIDSFTKDLGFTFQEVLDTAIKEGVLTGGVHAKEMEAYVKDGNYLELLQAAADKTTEFGQGIRESLGKKEITKLDNVIKLAEVGAKIPTSGLKKVTEALVTAYGAEDALPKLSIMMRDIKDQQTNYKLAKDVAHKPSLEKAARVAKQLAPHYGRLANAVFTARRFPFAGVFVAFPAATYQTTYNQVAHNLSLIRPEASSARGIIENYTNINWDKLQNSPNKDIILRRMRARGSARLASLFAVSTGGIGLATSVVSSGIRHILGDAEDDVSEEELNAAEQLLPEYYQNIEKTYIGKGSNGELEFLNTGRFNVYGQFKDTANTVLRAWDGGYPTTGSAAKAVADSMVGSFYTPTVVTNTIKEVKTGGESDFGKHIIVDGDGFIGNTKNVFNHMTYQFLENGTTKAVKRMHNWVSDEEKYNEITGVSSDAHDAIGGMIGLNPIKLDVKRGLAVQLFGLSRERRTIRTILGGRLKSFSKMTDEEIKEVLISAKKGQENIDKTRLIKIQAARDLGLSEEDILEAVKITKTGKREFEKNLSKGVLPEFNIDRIGKQSVRNIKFRSLDKDAKEIFESNYERARELMHNIPRK